MKEIALFEKKKNKTFATVNFLNCWAYRKSTTSVCVAKSTEITLQHPLAGLLRERKLEDVLYENEWKKVPTGECLHMHKKLGLFSSVYVAGIRSPIWKHLQKVFTWKILRH